VSLRKLAGLAAGFALAVGLIGAGVGAVFTDSVTAQENINVGTFSCGITAASAGATFGAIDALGYAHTVSYTAPTIMSSAAGSAPFSFTVKNTGSIADVLTVATSGVSGQWSIINSPFAPVPLASGASTTYSTGVQWTALDNTSLGAHGTATWAVSCNENAPAVIFDNTPATASAFYSPKLYWSDSLGALSQTQFGTQVGFAGSARKLQTVTVAMSDWACQTGGWNDGSCRTTSGTTFNVPITFNIYAVNADNSVGALLGTATQTFAIPYRPSADSTCPATGSQTPQGSAFRDSAGDCQNGLVSEITFTFTGVTLPNNVIFGIAYATTGDAGSLNVMLYPSDADSPQATQPAVGSFPLPDDAYINTGSGLQSVPG
jgi:hypothetical protein